MESYNICVWPDEWWCYANDFEDYPHESDDYQTLKIPENFDDNDIELIIALLKVNGRL